MIKKLIGIIVAVAVIVIIVVATIQRDNFQSMELRDGILNQTLPGPVVPAADLGPAATHTIGGADTLTMIQGTDSL